MTDNEKTVLEKLYDELCAELSTTQLNLDMWHDRAETMRNRLSAAQAENAKLRELCKAWYKFAYELFDEFIGEPEMNDDFMELDDRLRKIGVEPY